jgi:hypothetical protein
MRFALPARLALVLTAATGAGLSTVHAQAPAQKWDAFVSSFLDRYFAFEPASAVYAGRHEFDGQLADFSDSGLQREIDWLQAERAAAEAYPNSSLTKAQRFERDYLVMEVRKTCSG